MPATMTQEMKSVHGKRTAYLRRLGAMKVVRAPLIAHWSDLTRHILPRSGRFTLSDKDKGGAQSYNAIYDNTGTLAHGVLSAGMAAGITPQSQRWFKLKLSTPQGVESHAADVWLDEAGDVMAEVFNKSNLYDSLHQLYEDLGVFGTACMLVLEDFDNVIHCYPIGCGEYCLQQDYKGRVVTLYREFSKSVGEVVKEFGYENCSTQLQQQFNNRELDAQVELLHVIEPRADEERDLRSPLAKDMPWKSVYLEVAGTEEKLLREGGFEYLPLLAPRWRVNGGDVYGTSPGMTALGDVRQLQQEQLSKGRAIAYKAQPPLQVPLSMKDREQDGHPGSSSYFEPAQLLPFDQMTPNGGIRTAFEVNLDLKDLVVDIEDVRVRVRSAFHVDLFMMIQQSLDTEKTKYEVQQLVQEKMIVLGPMLQRLNHELLEPLIDIVFDQMLKKGVLPPPPPELLGAQLTVEFEGMLAQAQKAAGSGSTTQFMQEVLAVIEARPEAADKVNFDKWIERRAVQLGIPTDLIVDDETVKALRMARGRAQAQAEQTQVGREQAAAVKDLANAPINDENALGALARAVPA